MKTALILVPFLVAAMFASSSCSSTRSSRLEMGPETGSDAAIEEHLELLNPETVGMGTVRHVDLDLRNTSADRIECLVTADWFDQNGQLVPLVARRWLRVEIDGGGTRKMRFEPMPPTAQSFRLRYAPASN